MNYYQALPDPPERVNSPGIMKRLIDGLAFRYRCATDDLNSNEVIFRPVESSWNIEEVNNHIFHLVRLTAKALDVEYQKMTEDKSFYGYRNQTLLILYRIASALENMDDQMLAQKKVYLRRTETEYSFWYLINGFIADAISHVGQINSWRRMAGNPVGRISPFTGMPF